MKPSQVATAALFLAPGARSQFLVDPPTTADPNTIKDCTYWLVAASGETCESVASFWGVPLDKFKTWNPSVASSCSLIEGNSYCMEQNYGVPVETTTTTTARTTTTASSTTSAGNGITTPTPTQVGMVKNCNKFHLVAEGEGCSVIGQKYGVSLAQLYAWNPAIGSTCNNIWLNTYVCVGVVGGTGTTTTSTTTTSAGNGITTPTPTQEGMVKNCNKFHLVSEGEGCTVIGQKYGVSLAQMYAWNPAIGSTCNNIWLNTYVCVGVIGGTTTTTKATTTSAGNGITTPTPTQEGMVKNCNKFHLVSEGEGCASIGSKYGVSISSLVSWNPAIGSTCTNVWLNTYLCVGVIGGGGGTTFTTRTTTTTAGNGIATPTPTQPGMVSNCDRFHFVAENEGCATIATKYGIPLATFYSWNTGVGNNCQSLWGNTYVCVRTIGYVPPTTTTSRGNATPTPTQPGMISGCNRFHKVVSGDTCATIASRYSISLSTFYSWNPGAGNNCQSLWLDTYYCVGRA